MRRIILLSAILLSLYSCSKDTNNFAPPLQQVIASNPSVVSITWAPINEAGDIHPKFSVQLNIPDSNTVKLINLKRFNTGIICWTVNKPTTGTSIMWDHTMTFPTYSSQTFYQLEFEMTDGKKTLLDKFQVY